MPLTLGQFIRQAADALTASPTPRLDAEVLAMHATGFSRAQLITRAAETLATDLEAKLRELVARRAHGEPIAYLTGRREFWSLELSITPDVLIPRPETECLVEQALARIPQDATWNIADLGTGSGAVALAIAKERPHCRIIATDASIAALAIAHANADRLGLRNIEFRNCEWLDSFGGMRLAVIVSNPPYVREGDPHLAEGDVRFEPQAALVAGTDGLDAIRRIAAVAPAHIVPGGWLLLEHGADQRASVTRILAAAGFTEIIGFADLAGLDRVTAGRAPCSP